MKKLRPFLDGVVREALQVLRARKTEIFTFAFYHDHESRAVSACVDTEASSRRLVTSSNSYSLKHFWSAVESDDLKGAELWNGNVGRSLSLGDFAFVNLARADLPQGKIPKTLYVEMMRAIHAREEDIIKLGVSRDRLLFCCSGPDDEVAFMWSPRDAKRSERKESEA